jgi:hypothetical protein
MLIRWVAATDLKRILSVMMAAEKRLTLVVLQAENKPLFKGLSGPL